MLSVWDWTLWREAVNQHHKGELLACRRSLKQVHAGQDRWRSYLTLNMAIVNAQLGDFDYALWVLEDAALLQRALQEFEVRALATWISSICSAKKGKYKDALAGFVEMESVSVYDRLEGKGGVISIVVIPECEQQIMPPDNTWLTFQTIGFDHEISHFDVHFNIAWCLWFQARVEEAAEEISKALESAVNDRHKSLFAKALSTGFDAEDLIMIDIAVGLLNPLADRFSVALTASTDAFGTLRRARSDEKLDRVSLRRTISIASTLSIADSYMDPVTPTSTTHHFFGRRSHTTTLSRSTDSLRRKSDTWDNSLNRSTTVSSNPSEFFSDKASRGDRSTTILSPKSDNEGDLERKPFGKPVNGRTNTAASNKSEALSEFSERASQLFTPGAQTVDALALESPKSTRQSQRTGVEGTPQLPPFHARFNYRISLALSIASSTEAASSNGEIATVERPKAFPAHPAAAQQASLARTTTTASTNSYAESKLRRRVSIPDSEATSDIPSPPSTPIPFASWAEYKPTASTTNPQNELPVILPPPSLPRRPESLLSPSQLVTFSSASSSQNASSSFQADEPPKDTPAIRPSPPIPPRRKDSVGVQPVLLSDIKKIQARYSGIVPRKPAAGSPLAVNTAMPRSSSLSSGKGNKRELPKKDGSNAAVNQETPTREEVNMPPPMPGFQENPWKPQLPLMPPKSPNMARSGPSSAPPVQLSAASPGVYNPSTPTYAAPTGVSTFMPVNINYLSPLEPVSGINLLNSPSNSQSPAQPPRQPNHLQAWAKTIQALSKTTPGPISGSQPLPPLPNEPYSPNRSVGDSMFSEPEFTVYATPTLAVAAANNPNIYSNINNISTTTNNNKNEPLEMESYLSYCLPGAKGGQSGAWVTRWCTLEDDTFKIMVDKMHRVIDLAVDLNRQAWTVTADLAGGPPSVTDDTAVGRFQARTQGLMMRRRAMSNQVGGGGGVKAAEPPAYRFRLTHPSTMVMGEWRENTIVLGASDQELVLRWVNVLVHKCRGDKQTYPSFLIPVQKRR